MTEEQAQKVLDELQDVRPEVLNGEAKRLFEAIMKIADGRDRAYKELELKENMIDLMIEQLLGLVIFDNDKGEPLILDDEEELREYFENKAKEVGENEKNK